MMRVLLIFGAVVGIVLAGPTVGAVTKGPGSAGATSNRALGRTASAVEIVELKRAGVDAVVIKAYIESARAPYVATAEDVLFLHGHKVPDELIVAWMRKGGELVNAAGRARSAAAAAVAQNGQAPAGVPGGVQPQVIYQNPPVYQALPVEQPVYQSAPVVYEYPTYYGYGGLYVSGGWTWPYWGGYWPYYGYRGWYGHGYRHGHYGHHGHGGHYGHGGHGYPRVAHHGSGGRYGGHHGGHGGRGPQVGRAAGR